MCSNNYTDIAGECFKFSNDDLDWDKAQAKCKANGDQLAVPGDVEAFMKHILTMEYDKEISKIYPNWLFV